MQPLKRYFLGHRRSRPRRARTSSQKCFRTVDIDEVGNTARHLTFFEMMGNFSFGDYFKQQRDRAGLGSLDPARRLRARPRADLGHASTRATRSSPPTRRRSRCGARSACPPSGSSRLGGDNFWQAGPTGPCGPCSELYFDRGPEHGCGRPECAPGCECDRFLEFWNLVFIQYNMLEGGTLEPLPAPSVDTGAGLERVAALTEGVHSGLRDRCLRRHHPRDRALVGRAVRRRRAADRSRCACSPTTAGR